MGGTARRSRVATLSCPVHKNSYSSDTGTRTPVSCVKGKYADHLHHIGSTKAYWFLVKEAAITHHKAYANSRIQHPSLAPQRMDAEKTSEQHDTSANSTFGKNQRTNHNIQKGLASFYCSTMLNTLYFPFLSTPISYFPCVFLRTKREFYASMLKVEEYCKSLGD